jgi:hypothetical protein
LLDAGRVLLKLPHSLEQIITKLESGQIEVKITSNERSGRRRLRRCRSGRDNGESSIAGTN